MRSDPNVAFGWLLAWDVRFIYLFIYRHRLKAGTGPLDRLALPRWCTRGGGVITNTVSTDRIEVHAAEAVSSPLSIISLGDVGGGGGVTDRELQESPSKFQCD